MVTPKDSPPHPADAGGGHPRGFPGPGAGTRLWLLRHAEVHEDWQGRAYGNLDVPLSAAGLARTEELARDFARIRPALVQSSTLERARRLGEGLAGRTGAELEVHEALAEICRGTWQGRSVEELQEDAADDVRDFYADPWRWRGHGGECDEMLLERAGGVIEAGLARADGATLAVTTHYNVIRVVAAAALGVPPARSFALRVDPGRALCLVDSPAGWELRHSNVHAPPGAGEEEA